MYLIIEATLAWAGFYSVFYELRLKARPVNPGKGVGRGAESRQQFVITWSILSVLITQVVSDYGPLSHQGLAVTASVANILLLWLLCFRSDWFKNATVGVWMKINQAIESH